MTLAQFERYCAFVRRTKARALIIGGSGTSLILYRGHAQWTLYWDAVDIKLSTYNRATKKFKTYPDTGIKAIVEWEKQAGYAYHTDLDIELLLP